MKRKIKKVKREDESSPGNNNKIPRLSIKQIEKRNREIDQLYEDENLSLEEIGKRYGLSKEQVRQILQAGSIPSRKTARSKSIYSRVLDNMEYINSLMSDGYTIVEISGLLKMNRLSLQRILFIEGYTKEPKPGKG